MSGRHRKLRIFKWQTAAPALLLKIRWIILKILVCCSLANDLKEKWTFTKIKTFLRKSFCSFWLIKKTSNALSKLKHCKGYKGKSIFYSNICKCGFANHCWWSWILGLFQAFKEYNVCQISHDAFSDLINHHDRWHQARFSHSDKLISQTVKELGEKKNIADWFSGLVLHKELNTSVKMPMYGWYPQVFGDSLRPSYWI